jgi:hypothetical protein
MRKKKIVTWAEVGFRNAGFRTTSHALKFAMGWGLATAELGREPASVEEYAEVMSESRATAFRDQQAFRKAFPGEVNPARMNETSGAQAKYDELWRTLRNRKKAAFEAQPIMFTVGGAAAFF